MEDKDEDIIIDEEPILQHTNTNGNQSDTEPLENSEKVLFLDHLEKPFTRDQLKALLNQHGNMKNMHLIQSKSRAFVWYENEQALQSAKNSIDGLNWDVNKKTLRAIIVKANDMDDLENRPTELIGEENLYLVNSKETDVPKLKISANKFSNVDLYSDKDSQSLLCEFSSLMTLASFVIESYNKQYKSSSIHVIDITGGIGGTSIAFATRKNVTKVMCIESDKSRFKALTHNVKALKLDDKIECLNLDSIAWLDEQLERIIKRSIIFIDPPLKVEDTNAEKVYDMFLLSGDKENNNLNSVSVSDLIDKYVTKCKMLALKLPANFEFGILFDKYDCKTKKLARQNFTVVIILGVKKSHSDTLNSRTTNEDLQGIV